MTLPADLEGQTRLKKFLEDCELLGPVRFVAMTDGAILETVGSFGTCHSIAIPCEHSTVDGVWCGICH
jgi:hypothetical protein